MLGGNRIDDRTFSRVFRSKRYNRMEKQHRIEPGPFSYLCGPCIKNSNGRPLEYRILLWTILRNGKIAVFAEEATGGRSEYGSETMIILTKAKWQIKNQLLGYEKSSEKKDSKSFMASIARNNNYCKKTKKMAQWLRYAERMGTE